MSFRPILSKKTLACFECAANKHEIIEKLEMRASQAETDRDDFITKLKIAEEKVRSCEARAVDAERRATHAVGRARRLGVGFGNVKGDGI